MLREEGTPMAEGRNPRSSRAPLQIQAAGGCPKAYPSL